MTLQNGQLLSKCEIFGGGILSASSSTTTTTSSTQALGGGGGPGGGPPGDICSMQSKEKYTATRFGYAKNGETVTYVTGEWWCWDGVDANCPTNYTMTFAREFRYDGSRQRYLDRQFDPAQFPEFVSLTDTWSDYDGDNIYYSATPGVNSSNGAYEPGIGRVIDGTLEYTHSDMIGTLRTTSDSLGNYTSNRVYTAFGEEITNNTDRFAYVGDWGYQSHTEFPYLHVGARYYDPSTGRFLQRDPIGINGGFNVYVYVNNQPTAIIDPSGLGFWDSFKDVVNAVLPIVGIPVGAALIVIGVAITSPVWGPVAIASGVVVIVATAITIKNDISVWRTANRVVSPIVPGVRRRNRAVDSVMDCGG